MAIYHANLAANRTHVSSLIYEEPTLNSAQIDSLRANCTNWIADATVSRFVFTAQDFNDWQDRTVTVYADGSWTMTRPDCCVCEGQRGPAQCHCHPCQCSVCGRELTGVDPSCEFEYCLQDDCPLCSHEREFCAYETIRDGIADTATELLSQRQDHPGYCTADAYVEAVAQWQGASSGEAPLFPVIGTMLDEIINREWRLPDGSEIGVSRDGQWLHVMEPVIIAVAR